MGGHVGVCGRYCFQLTCSSDGKINMLAMLKFSSYDETPLPVRLPEDEKSKLVLRSRIVKRARAGTAKVKQGEVDVAFVYQCWH